MGKQSTRENKTIYQLCREAAGLTRAEASERMDAVSDSKIEKFEYETQEPKLYKLWKIIFTFLWVLQLLIKATGYMLTYIFFYGNAFIL